MNLQTIVERSLPYIGMLILEAVLLLLSFVLVEKSFEGALKGVKVAIKSEISTDAGRLNLVALLMLVFLLIFNKLHDSVTTAGNNQHLSGAQEPNPLLQFLMISGFALGSVFCVGLFEIRRVATERVVTPQVAAEPAFAPQILPEPVVPQVAPEPVVSNTE